MPGAIPHASFAASDSPSALDSSQNVSVGFVGPAGHGFEKYLLAVCSIGGNVQVVAKFMISSSIMSLAV